jgi:integrase/recombinase XerD
MTQLRDDASAPCGAVHFTQERPMNPLRRHMIDEMQIRNLTANTQRAYIEQVARFARYFGKSPELLGPTEIRTYLLYLANERS